MPRPRRTVDTATGEITTQEQIAEAKIASLAMNIFEDGFDEKPLAWKLARIRGMVGNIPKTGYNNFHKYSYTTETDLVSRIGPLLAAAGIIIVPSVEEHDLIQYGGDGQKAGRLTILKLHYTVTDGRQTLEGNMIGYGDDAGDKGAYKAITGAMKYVLMKLFLVDTGDDPEADTKTDARRTPAQRVPTKVTKVEPKAVEYEATIPAPVIEESKVENVQRGGRTTGPSAVQMQRLGTLMRDAGWNSKNLVVTIQNVFGDEIILPTDQAEWGPVMRAYFNDLTAEDMGQLISALEEEIGNDEPEPVPYG